ncbi:hypothetical protein HDU76_010757 [Blyttiomyces sp. JEL0837]|nr:hypothetical protein HDU76_010757 [Blyttiomyces sp. JEL0837]
MNYNVISDTNPTAPADVGCSSSGASTDVSLPNMMTSLTLLTSTEPTATHQPPTADIPTSSTPSPSLVNDTTVFIPSVVTRLPNEHHKHETPPTISTLPRELQLDILSFLLPKHLSRVSVTSRHFNSLFHERYLWLQMIERRFGRDKLPKDDSANSLKAYLDLTRPYLYATELTIALLEDNWQLIGTEEELNSSGDGRIRKIPVSQK